MGRNSINSEFMLIIKKFILIALFIPLCNIVFSQEVEIKFIISDIESSKLVNNCVIFLEPYHRSLVTDDSGTCSIILTSSKFSIKTERMGYKQFSCTYYSQNDTIIYISLYPETYPINPVVVKADTIDYFRKDKYSNFSISRKSIKEFPKQLSEPDIMKVFQSIPGVLSGREGSSDIYVRGGTAGQNIAYSNGASFFVPNHLYGSVSIFDSEFMENASLLKDFIPAKFGGGASSVLSLDYRKSKLDSFELITRIGILSSGAILDIPILKNKAGLSVGFKRSNYTLYYPILTTLLGKELNKFFPPSDYSYLDGFLRFDYLFSSGSEVTFLYLNSNDNAYRFEDNQSLRNDTTVLFTQGDESAWKNSVYSISFKSPTNKAILVELDLSISQLNLKRNIYSNTKWLVDDSEIRTTGINNLVYPKKEQYKLGFNLSNKGRTLSFGLDAKLSNNDTRINVSYEDADAIISNELGLDVESKEISAYMSFNPNLSKGISLNSGIRISGYFVESSNYLVLEPRIRITSDIFHPYKVNLTYNRLSQNDHYIESSAIGLRTAFWMPSSLSFAPEISDIVSLGVSRQLFKKIDFEASIYAKTINGMVDLKPGASFLRSEHLIALLEQIEGKAYGLELSCIKSNGKIQGMFNYTYSRSLRTWDSNSDIQWISSLSDRPHNIAITSKYIVNPKISFGLNWKYTSGLPATLYIHTTSYGEWFEHKNNIRFPSYHSLDFSFSYKIKSRFFSTDFDFNVTNLYNRKNTYYLKRVFDEEKNRLVYRNISLFPIMPSMSITLVF